VVLCGTVKAVGSTWAHQIVNASRVGGRPRMFVVQMKADAYVDQLALGTTVARYCDDPAQAVRDLIDGLMKHFPPSTAAELLQSPN
jgi:hypothetical protein